VDDDAREAVRARAGRGVCDIWREVELESLEVDDEEVDAPPESLREVRADDTVVLDDARSGIS
jgi:hypothetical protein